MRQQWNDNRLRYKEKLDADSGPGSVDLAGMLCWIRFQYDDKISYLFEHNAMKEILKCLEWNKTYFNPFMFVNHH